MIADTLIRNGIAGYMSQVIVGKFNSILAAVEYLIPIVHDEEFTSRYETIMKY